jgi:arginyl-tRNA synthetase
MRDEVDKLLRAAAARLLEKHAPHALDLVSNLSVVPPKTPEHGDFASNAALLMAKALGRPPREVAQLLSAELGNGGGALERTEIAGPGFLNVFLSRSRWREAIARVLREGASFGRSAAGAGSEVMVEFVSANPTGPLTIGHGRNAVLGDCIASLLEATGHKVVREYYFNDAGRQMRVLAQSLRARYLQQLGDAAELPEEGYQGEYLVEIARALVAEAGASWRPRRDSRRARPRRSSPTSSARSRRWACASIRTSTSTRSSSASSWTARSRTCARPGWSSSRTAPSGCARRASASSAIACW